MQQSTKPLLWIALPILVFSGLAWTVVNIQRGIKSAYYEWGITCIIASYAEDHEGVPPSSWSDLVGYEYHTKYLPNPRSMESASQHVAVDFGSLLAFKNGDISSLPVDVVTPIRGIEQHWIAPSTTLERYFRDGERPHGSFDGEYAEKLRYASKGGGGNCVRMKKRRTIGCCGAGLAGFWQWKINRTDQQNPILRLQRASICVQY